MRKGGLKDDGLNEDPVSGNKVPSGSMAKEVRDDIPAMLSEGEYVVPADVLRFYGVNFFEDLRNKAKSGLTNMEKNGRIGGTPLSQEDISRNMQQSMQPPSQPMPPVPPQPMAEGGGTSGITESPRVRKDPFRPTPEEEEGLLKMEANPKSREDIEEPRATIGTYEVDGRMQNAIDFKDGTRMYAFEILNRFRDAKTAADPVLEFGIGKETSRMIDQYLDEANPTKEEFIKYFFEQRRLANGGVIGASNGPDMGTYTSGYNPATARYAMFQGTSSQQQAQAAAEEAAVGEEITYSRIHYNSKGQFITIQYVGTDDETAIPAEGQNQQLKDYPLTEGEWKALQKEMANSGDGDGGGTDPDSVAAGSSTEWMKGINFDSNADVKKWADETLKGSGITKFMDSAGPILQGVSGISKGAGIAKVRGVAAGLIGSEDSSSIALGEQLLEDADAAVKSGGLITSAFDKLGLMSGASIAKQLSENIFDFGLTRTAKDAYGNSIFETDAEFQAQLQKVAPEGMTYQGDSESGSYVRDDDDEPFKELKGVTKSTSDSGSTIFDITDSDAFKESGGIRPPSRPSIGNNKGGLATKRKTKNKSPKKTGLAGKR